jgi:hypothetical protein
VRDSNARAQIVPSPKKPPGSAQVVAILCLLLDSRVVSDAHRSPRH